MYLDSSKARTLHLMWIVQSDGSRNSEITKINTLVLKGKSQKVIDFDSSMLHLPNFNGIPLFSMMLYNQFNSMTIMLLYENADLASQRDFSVCITIPRKTVE